MVIIQVSWTSLRSLLTKIHILAKKIFKINLSKIRMTSSILLDLQSPHRTLDTALPDLKSLGYDGIEIPLKSILHFGSEKFKALIKVTVMQNKIENFAYTTFFLWMRRITHIFLIQNLHSSSLRIMFRWQ